MTRPTFTVAVLLFLLNGSAADRPNVLFLVADDLRPDIGCYGNSAVDTPHLDRLAKEGVRFERAYCQIASCGPSRASFLTGRRPDTTKIYDNRNSFREHLPDAVTLPQHFKEHGYFTMSLGKVFHGKFQSEIREDPASWSVPAWRPTATQYLQPESIAVLEERYPEIFDGKRPLEEVMNLRRFKGPAWEAPDVADGDLTDGRTAAKAVEALGRLAKRDEPFFLAVGFVKPHAPFVAPKRYFEKVHRDEIRMPTMRERPAGTSDLASTSREMHGYHGVPAAGVFPDAIARNLTVAYEACVNYIDAQVGKVVAELERLGLRDDTIIVFTADHGYHLGEVGQWCKNTNFEESLRVPLIVSSPHHTAVEGQVSDGLLELVDLHPSLSDLCGLPVRDDVEGTSFLPLLDDPGREWKKAAFSQHAAKLYDPEAPVGRSLRTEGFRYVQWQGPDGASVAEELYAMNGTLTPSRNIASDPEQRETVERMRRLLAGGWEEARPDSRR